MADWIVFMIYWGGAISNWHEKRGFWSRVGWPVELGEKLYTWAKMNEIEKARGRE